MAEPTIEIINALRKTAEMIAESPNYQWGHMGSCNCGHLAQVVTPFTREEIHNYAMEKAAGEWADQIVDYCPTSGYPMDKLIESMLNMGFTREDLSHLEKLSDHQILSEIPFEKRRYIRHNQRDDVVLYLQKWADLLDRKLDKILTDQKTELTEEVMI